MKTPTHLEQEIARAIQAHEKKIRRLRQQAAAEQRKINEKVVVLLHGQEPALYERLAREATDALAAEKAKRSSRARKSVASSHDVPAAQPVEHALEETEPWNR